MRVIALAFIAAGLSLCQQPASPDTLNKILDRLDTLEKQNQALLAEIKALREEVKNQQSQPAQDSEQLHERVDAAEERIAEQAQTKVSSSQRWPISLTGMFLFDTYLVHGTNNPRFQQSYGDYGEGAPGGNATLRQSIIGLEFHGPQIVGGGQIHGSLSMDFFSSVSYKNDFRIRRGTVSLDWKRRSLVFGQDKPLIAPLQPTSFARVGIPPLSGAGNLWFWRPQLRYEERVSLSAATELTLQAGVLATAEVYGTRSLPATAQYDDTRPAIEGRMAIEHKWSDQSRISFGAGAHASSSHAVGESVPSRVVSSDFLIKPSSWLEVSGTLLHGENFANLGGLPISMNLRGASVIPIRGTAGWMQIALPVTSRLTFDIYAGRQLNVGRDLTAFQAARTFVIAGNVLYRVAPNVVLGFEGSHESVGYLNKTQILANRYDATVAYLF